MEETFVAGLIDGLTKEAKRQPSEQATAPVSEKKFKAGPTQWFKKKAEAETPAWLEKFMENFSESEDKEAEAETEAEPQAPTSPMDAVRAKLGLDKEAEAPAEEPSLMDKLREKLGMTKEAEDKEKDEKKAKAEGKKKEKEEDKEEKEEEEEEEGKKEASASNIFELWKEAGKKKSMKLGGGGRFAELKARLAKQGEVEKEAKVYDPGALAAAIGREKYGKKKFQEMAAKGRKKKK